MKIDASLGTRRRQIEVGVQDSAGTQLYIKVLSGTG